MTGPLDVVSTSADQIRARLDALRAAIAAVQVNGKPLGEAVRWEPGARIGDPIEVIIAPPDLEYRSNNLGPSMMILEVFVIAVASDLTVFNLISLERGVADAIDLMEDPYEATVRRSNIGSWRRGGVDLPAYRIEVEMDVNRE